MHIGNDLNSIAENRLLQDWLKNFSRSPNQFNQPHQTDAELISTEGSDVLQAITTDTISEEIALGFYRNPYTIGWMSATVTLSDLSAVGTSPAGIVASITIPENTTKQFRLELAAGLEGACRDANTFILGGDTNFGDTISITTSGLGNARGDKVLTRTGCRPGDLLYATGPLGTGGPVAAAAFFGEEGSEVENLFRPRARIHEGQNLAGFASSCMDSSDGLIATLDQLARLNHVGFELTQAPEELVADEVLFFCRKYRLDPYLMLAQPHGEFELIFTVPPNMQEKFEQYFKSFGLEFLQLGYVTADQHLKISGPKPRIIDSTRVRNLFNEVNGDFSQYFKELPETISSYE